MRPSSIFSKPTTQLVGLVLLINLVCLALAFASYTDGQASLSAWIVAYTLGLRHGFDADHIAIIDNSVRRLYSLKKQSIFTGFFFALGHSSVVFIGTIVIVLFSRTFSDSTSHYAEIGATIATMVSIVFLTILGLMNIGSILFRKASSSNLNARVIDVNPSSVPTNSIFGNLISRFTSKIQSSWALLPIGMLFGLGFETTTEVALLANAARDGANGLAVSTILLYPFLFMAGMLAIDSLDGLLMFKAFDWFKSDNLRRNTYNIIISLLTGTVALTIAIIQSLSLLHDRVVVGRVLSNLIQAFSSNTEMIGMSIAAFLLTFWIGSMLISRLRSKRIPSP